MNLELVLTLLGTVVTTAAFLYIFAPAATYLRLIDEPDQQRKLHKGRVPLTGGLSLFIAIVVVFYVSGLAATSLTASHNFWPVTTAVLAILVMVHAVDDIVELRAETRLAIDATLALFICLYAAVKLTTLGQLFDMGQLTLGRFAIAMTVFCFVAASNAFNMVDGIDSLCSGLAIIALLTLMALIAIGPREDSHMMACILVMVSALLVAYVANQGLLGTRMRVFLGDSGARLIAFVVAIALVVAAERRLIHPVMAYFPIAIPVCDCLVLMATRLLHRRSPVSADRLHLHHLLQDVGLSTTQTRRVILAMAVLVSLCGVTFEAVGAPDWVMTIFVVVTFFAYMAFRFRLMHLAAGRQVTRSERPARNVEPGDSTDTATVSTEAS